MLHQFTDFDQTLLQKYVLDFKFLMREILIVGFVSDFVSLQHSLPVYTFRFSRYFRPAMIFIYHKELAKQVEAVYKSNNEIIQMALFIMTVTFSFALISVIVIGNVSVPHDELAQNYSNFSLFSVTLYGFISFDCYPDEMLPAI